MSTIHDHLRRALDQPYPPIDHVWSELEEMAMSSPEAAIDLACELARQPISPRQRGWLAAGPLRTAIGSANELEQDELEKRAESDPMFAALLDALVRYENKQRIVTELLEGRKPDEIAPRVAQEPVVIPNIHDRSSEHAIGEEAWSKIVQAVDAAPEDQLFLLASTILETLLLRNEQVIDKPLLDQLAKSSRFRRALSFCDLSFSEPFLDDLIESLR